LIIIRRIYKLACGRERCPPDILGWTPPGKVLRPGLSPSWQRSLSSLRTAHRRAVLRPVPLLDRSPANNRCANWGDIYRIPFSYNINVSCIGKYRYFSLIVYSLTIQHLNDTIEDWKQQEAQLMLTTGSTRLAVSRGQQIWYHSTCNI